MSALRPRAGVEALVETAEALSAAGLRTARVSVGATPGIDTLARVPGLLYSSYTVI